jgi:hypothetical protein
MIEKFVIIDCRYPYEYTCGHIGMSIGNDRKVCYH